MKAAVADEAKRTAKWNRKPDARYMESFNFAINRAKHYSNHTGKPVEDILNEWEEKRDHNFISFYSAHKLPKFNTGSLKKHGINQVKKWYKRENLSPRYRSKRIIQLIQSVQPKRIKKARWSNEYKARKKQHREYLKRSL